MNTMRLLFFVFYHPRLFVKHQNSKQPSLGSRDFAQISEMDAQELRRKSLRLCSVLPDVESHDKAFHHVPEHGFSMFLKKRTKIVHFVRHAEGFHNEAVREFGDETPTIYSTPGSERYLDARLNTQGIEQCKAVRDSLGSDVNPSLVVVSPLTRTLETAHHIFGGRHLDGTSSLPFLVHDICRERWGKFTNDKRRSKSEIRPEFEAIFKSTGDSIDFDSHGFRTDEDSEWTEERESDESCSKRGIELLCWLSKRPEKEIAVVTHSSFLRHLFKGFGETLSSEDRTSLQRTYGNAEVRSVTLAAHTG